MSSSSGDLGLSDPRISMTSGKTVIKAGEVRGGDTSNDLLLGELLVYRLKLA